MFEVLKEGDVYAAFEDNIAIAGSRIAPVPGGGYICSFHTESALGVNDFVPMISYSKDGENWEEPTPLFPSLVGKKSIFCSVRPTYDGRISASGVCYNIDRPGEVWWSDEIAGMKENDLIFTFSSDGKNWDEPAFVKLPYYGGAESPGGMLVDRDGTVNIVYAPYPTIEAREEVDTCCLVFMRSRDGGKTFESKKIGIVPAPSEYAETWIERLSDGRLFISTWQTASENAPDQYLISDDDGESFKGPFAYPFKGQSTSITPLPGGGLITVYNQRKEEPKGVWGCVSNPGENNINVSVNTPLWRAVAPASKGGDGFDSWCSFSFGEPQITLMPDGNYLLTLWYEEGNKKAIKYVILKG